MMHSQITGHRSAGWYLSRRGRSAILVGSAEACAVDKSELLGVVQECVEYRAGVEDQNLVEVAVRPVERADVGRQLRIVVC